jgi:ribose-phosphate pyrophosphokinase
MIGDVQGKTCIIIDDLIDTGTRLASSTNSVMKAGAVKVYAAATHALLSHGAVKRFKPAAIAANCGNRHN